MGITGANEHVEPVLTPCYQAQISYPLGKLCRGLKIAIS
ncbi:MAG: hypothetical protein OFPII_07440 [Osedax symbiont Rs1]|nr:MAG: hypothetical protein OFPII_07440 [Osedax symbiont Rs1]